jgi:hypothetical protein
MVPHFSDRPRCQINCLHETVARIAAVDNCAFVCGQSHFVSMGERIGVSVGDNFAIVLGAGIGVGVEQGFAVVLG